MNVIISGLTAAGKTTHCKILSDKFNLSYVSVADVMMKASGIHFKVKSTDPKLWITKEAQQLTALRKENKDIDLFVDSELKKLSYNKHNIIFDAWGLPWLTNAYALRIWIESSEESRLLKSITSHRYDKHFSISDILSLVHKKDTEARHLFRSLYAFDIFHDRDVFDLVINISTFIRKPHILSAKRSIKLADQIISSFVGWRIENKMSYKKEFQKLFALFGRDVFSKFPSDLID